MRKKWDIIVVGAGHAGCEAALSAARMGMRVLLATMDINAAARMSCNPAIGGLAKGHLVKEIDSLGGEMGKASDATAIQYRMLNRSKGPAVWSPRAQIDRGRYSVYMKKVLLAQKRLDVVNGMVTGLTVKNGEKFVQIRSGDVFKANAVIITTGTFMNGLVHVGMNNYHAGRTNEHASVLLTDHLEMLGFKIKRFKTGTPPRIDRETIDYSVIEEQKGDEEPVPFSYSNTRIRRQQMSCYLTWTNSRTHDILREGFTRSPLFTGVITGTGPRYCPSIETKIERFSDKDRHQIILEPEGRRDRTFYVNGFSTSLPVDIQIRGLRTIPGLEHVQVIRPGYAIEYDYVPPMDLRMTMESTVCEGIYLAGQINGTSGYEEAGAQGLVAGINAVLKLRGEEPFIPDRSSSYTGVMLDDLITKGVDEPYRMFTSRAEYRLLLRQDNADERLMAYGYRFGLISEEIYRKTVRKTETVASLRIKLKSDKPEIDAINPVLKRCGTAEISTKTSLEKLLKRPQIGWKDILPFVGERAGMRKYGPQVEMEIKYAGYLSRQKDAVKQFAKHEKRLLPAGIDYGVIKGLSNEGREKLQRVQPNSIGQASRIPGVTPADIAVLMVYLKKRNVPRETENQQ